MIAITPPPPLCPYAHVCLKVETVANMEAAQGGLRAALLKRFEVQPSTQELGRLKAGLRQRRSEPVRYFFERIVCANYTIEKAIYP
jgi:hypothetical protein